MEYFDRQDVGFSFVYAVSLAPCDIQIKCSLSIAGNRAVEFGNASGWSSLLEMNEC